MRQQKRKKREEEKSKSKGQDSELKILQIAQNTTSDAKGRQLTVGLR